MKSPAVPLHSVQGANHPFVQRIQAAHTRPTHLGPFWVSQHLQSYHMFVSHSPLFSLVMAPKHKDSGADNSDMPKRSQKALPLSENVKILDNKKKSYTELAKIYGKNESCIHEIVKKEKGNTCEFAKRDHVHITFIIVQCYNCSIFLLVIIVHVLLCPIYKLNFITGTYG